MPYALSSQRNRRKARRLVNVHQNSFAKGYISTIDNSRRPTDSLSDMTNMEVVQDNVARPRPPLVKYGTQPALPVVGRIKMRHSGVRSMLFVLNDNGTGKLYKQTDGGAFSLLGGNFSVSAWTMGVQSKALIYFFNAIDKLSYLDLKDNTLHTYSPIATPVISSVTKTGMTGAAFTHYYRVSANNDVGESTASVVFSVTSGKIRDSWVDQTDYTTVSWGAVTGATSYTIYYGSSATDCNELYTVSGNATTTFTDYGTLATNPFKPAPEGNSTEGAVFTWMYVDAKNSQVFGITADNKLFYSAPGTGDFSPYNGGGWVGIDTDGDTVLNFVDGFRNGKGDPVITVSARGAAGKGKLFHVSFDQMTVGDQVLTYPNVYEANGQSGTYAPRATIKARDSLFYFTGQDVRSTGTSQNIVNILTTATISQVIEPDIARVNLATLHKAVGVEYRDKLYFGLPVGSDDINEIWVLDLSRRNMWILRWPIAVKDMWLYEDSQGNTHFCVLVDNKILEFSRAGANSHTDDGTPWKSRIAFQSLVWDEDGITLGKIRRIYAKLLFPKGVIQINTTGLTRKGASTATGSDLFTTTTTYTGVGSWFYSAGHMYGEDPGEIKTFGKSVALLKVKPKGLLNQLDWEVVSETSGTDYVLSSVNTRGVALDELTLRS